MPRVFISHSSQDRDFVEGEIIPDTLHAAEHRYLGLPRERSRPPSSGSEKHQTRPQSLRLVPAPDVAEIARLRVGPGRSRLRAITNRTGQFIPILLEDCDAFEFHMWLPRLQHIDYRKDRAAAKQALISAIRPQAHTPDRSVPVEERSYSKDISTRRPGCIIFLLDQSYRMLDGICGTPRRIIDAVATTINRQICDLILISDKAEEKPRHYFDVGVIGYSAHRNDPQESLVRSMLRGATPGPCRAHDLVSIVDLFDDPLREEQRSKMIDDGFGDLISTQFQVPIWYEAPPEDEMGGAPMAHALERCRRIATGWCRAHPESFPPVVIHFARRESIESHAEAAADPTSQRRDDRRLGPAV